MVEDSFELAAPAAADSENVLAATAVGNERDGTEQVLAPANSLLLQSSLVRLSVGHAPRTQLACPASANSSLPAALHFQPRVQRLIGTSCGKFDAERRTVNLSLNCLAAPGPAVAAEWCAEAATAVAPKKPRLLAAREPEQGAEGEAQMHYRHHHFVPLLGFVFQAASSKLLRKEYGVTTVRFYLEGSDIAAGLWCVARVLTRW